jgi:hypothetical protein
MLEQLGVESLVCFILLLNRSIINEADVSDLSSTYTLPSSINYIRLSNLVDKDMNFGTTRG